MIGKIKNTIIEKGVRIVQVTLNEIEAYLAEVKEAIRSNRYRIELNSRRQDNMNLFIDFVIDEAKAKNILLGLTSTDFSEILNNEHKGYEHERLYVFEKDAELLERAGDSYRTVSLYIKLNKLEDSYVIVVSMHEQRYSIKYYFK